MVQILVTLIGAAMLLSRGVAAAPMPDSSINEPGVTSPDGTPITIMNDPTPALNYNAPSSSPMMDEQTSMMMEQTSMMMEQTSMMSEPTSTMMMEQTSTMMSEPTTMVVNAVSTSTPTYATSTISYRSGNNGWNTGYDSCVQQCMNSYGAPPAQYTPPPSTTTADNGSSGGGATHTVIVAPTKGILRFVPFALNATVGDTIHYVWGAGPHTVTKSSILEPCNKTSDAGAFNSGPLNATATFDQVVTDTNPLFFYCNVPGHCAKGMFGIVNAPSASAAPTTVGSMMPAMISNSTSLATMLMYTNNKTMGTSAYSWGNNLDLSNVPTWAHEETVTNIMYTRLVFAANPGMLENGGGASMSDSSPIVIPGDISQLAADSGSAAPPANNAGGSSVASPTGSSALPSGTTGPSSGASSNGAVGSTIASSSVVIGIVAIVVSLMAL